MKNQNLSEKRGASVRESRFPAALFAIYLTIFLLMSGVHMGLLIGMNRMELNGALQTAVPILYWSAMAIGLTLFTRSQIKKTYEEPMQKLAEAARQVANGDFSIYVPAIHTADRFDYLDVMILNFNKMVEELGSIETLKTDFLSNVSHEMKTPIAVIKNYGELIESGRLSADQRKEYAAAIQLAATKLSDLISTILKLNKLENQRIPVETQRYDVCRQLCECILQMEDQWEEKDIDLRVNLEETARVYADESLLELVWNNLLSNAIKFTAPGGRVEVVQTSGEDGVTVAVSDTGCGMSAECMKHIFDQFYQGDTSHSREGNGLGLALVKRVVELVDGQIQVSSEEGKGSLFTVILPAHGAAHEHEYESANDA